MQEDRNINNILELSQKLFFSQGFSGTTMDEIASGLGISKKTLYQYFPGKEFLIERTLERFLRDFKTRIDEVICDTGLNTPEKLSRLLGVIKDNISRPGPVLLKDMRKKYPHIWAKADKFRQENVLKNFRLIFVQGRQEGIVRDDIDVDLLLQIYIAAVRNIINPEVLGDSNYSAREVFAALMKIIFEGVLTDKGKQDVKIHI